MDSVALIQTVNQLSYRSRLLLLLCLLGISLVFAQLIFRVACYGENPATIKSELFTLQASNDALKKQYDDIQTLLQDERNQTLLKQYRQSEITFANLLTKYAVDGLPKNGNSDFLEWQAQLTKLDEDIKIVQISKTSEDGLPGVSIQFKGSYFDVLGFLQRIEASHPNLVWDKLTYIVNQYPTADVTLEVHFGSN